jgi:hypothetical protein
MADRLCSLQPACAHERSARPLAHDVAARLPTRDIAPAHSVTDHHAPPDDGSSGLAAHHRRLADCILAAAVERAGFIVVTGAPVNSRRSLVQAIAETAAGFQVVEIARVGNGHLSGPAAAGKSAASGAATTPLFVIDDAAQSSSEGLREICENAPLSREWAAMLSVRAVLITRFAVTELAFLEPRITALIPFAEAGASGDRAASAPAESPRGAAADGRAAADRRRAGRAAGGGAPQTSPNAGRSTRRDLRPHALLVYLAIVGALTGCYLALQTRRDAGSRPPARVAAARGADNGAARGLATPAR